MKIKAKIEVELEAKSLRVSAGVRYWEDATVNGVEDTDGMLIPCVVGGRWCPEIDVDSGIITNWEPGKTAKIHYKVCDDGVYGLYNEDDALLFEKEGYVPDCLSVGDQGYGDYIIMTVDESGKIQGWKPDFDDFIVEE